MSRSGILWIPRRGRGTIRRGIRARGSLFGRDAAARQGVYAPVYSASFGARNRIVIAPGDSRSMTLVPEKCEGYCQGVDGRAGPNLACEECGQAVATRMDDCGMWQTVWLDPDAVERRPSGLPAGRPPDWDDLERAEHRVPPVEPDGSWSRRWEAAVGVMLAHLVAATEGRPVTLPVGPVADLLGYAVGRYLLGGPETRTVGLALAPGSARPGPAPTSSSSPAIPSRAHPGIRPASRGLWCRWTAGSGRTWPTPARLRPCPRPECSRSVSCATHTPCRHIPGAR